MSAQNISKPTSVGFLMQKSQFIRLKPASSQISELLIMKSYFEHLSNKNISLKITIEKILRILLRIYKIKKRQRKYFLCLFTFCNAKRTHWNQWLSASSGKKLVFLAVVGFCYQCFENPFGYLLIRFFGGPQDISNPIGKAWIVREVTQV